MDTSGEPDMAGLALLGEATQQVEDELGELTNLSDMRLDDEDDVWWEVGNLAIGPMEVAEVAGMLGSVEDEVASLTGTDLPLAVTDSCPRFVTTGIAHGGKEYEDDFYKLAETAHKVVQEPQLLRRALLALQALADKVPCPGCNEDVDKKLLRNRYHASRKTCKDCARYARTWKFHKLTPVESEYDLEMLPAKADKERLRRLLRLYRWAEVGANTTRGAAAAAPAAAVANAARVLATGALGRAVPAAPAAPAVTTAAAASVAVPPAPPVAPRAAASVSTAARGTVERPAAVTAEVGTFAGGAVAQNPSVKGPVYHTVDAPPRGFKRPRHEERVTMGIAVKSEGDGDSDAIGTPIVELVPVNSNVSPVTLSLFPQLKGMRSQGPAALAAGVYEVRVRVPGTVHRETKCYVGAGAVEPVTQGPKRVLKYTDLPLLNNVPKGARPRFPGCYLFVAQRHGNRVARFGRVIVRPGSSYLMAFLAVRTRHVHKPADVQHLRQYARIMGLAAPPSALAYGHVAPPVRATKRGGATSTRVAASPPAGAGGGPPTSTGSATGASHDTGADADADEDMGQAGKGAGAGQAGSGRSAKAAARSRQRQYVR